jgi:hypothetical protein
MSVPNPATTDWVPIGGGLDLRYNGSWVAGTYTDGDIVIYNGIAYLAVRTTTQTPTAWPSLPSPVAYSTSLPGSPVDGQEAILVDSVSNPTYQWKFRYNASSSSVYKWEYIGGTPWFATAYAGAWTQWTGNGTWIGISPTFTAPRAGDYWIAWSAQSYSSTNGNLIQYGAGVPNGQAGTVQSFTPPDGQKTASFAFDQRMNGFSQGSVLQPVVWAMAATPYIANLACRINPARVS